MAVFHITGINPNDPDCPLFFSELSSEDRIAIIVVGIIDVGAIKNHALKPIGKKNVSNTFWPGCTRGGLLKNLHSVFVP